MKFLVLIASIGFVLTNVATASETTTTTVSSTPNQTTTSIREVLGNKKFEENEQITDAKLKAESGSLSKYSLSASLSYYGPTLGDLSAKDQPNPDASIGAYETSLGGSLGGRYRISKTETLSTGTGIKAIHPFHGIERFEMNNPYLTYAVTNRNFGIQMKNSIGVSAITVPKYVAIGEYAGLNLENNLVYDFGTSGFAVGFETSLGYYFYNRGYDKKDKKANDYFLGFYPSVKYNFTDKLNMNTSLSIGYANMRSNKSRWNLENKTITQRLGVGYAITRDIFISPYLSFFPDNISDKETSLNISTSFSVL